MTTKDITWEFNALEMSAYRRAGELGFLLVKNPDPEVGGYLLADDRNCVVFGSDYSADLDDVFLWLVS